MSKKLGDTAPWMAVFKEKGHIPRGNEDDWPVEFEYADDIHNGPVCVNCGYCTCLWCTPKDKIPVCKERGHEAQTKTDLGH